VDLVLLLHRLDLLLLQTFELTPHMHPYPAVIIITEVQNTGKGDGERNMSHLEHSGSIVCAALKQHSMNNLQYKYCIYGHPIVSTVEPMTVTIWASHRFNC
jgi:hypothetical protein